jgi:hypothetical protein
MKVEIGDLVEARRCLPDGAVADRAVADRAVLEGRLGAFSDVLWAALSNGGVPAASYDGFGYLAAGRRITHAPPDLPRDFGIGKARGYDVKPSRLISQGAGGGRPR